MEGVAMRSVLALFILSFMLIGAGCSMTIRHAFAQEEQLAPIGQPTTPPDHAEGHAEHHDVYKTWNRPDMAPGFSCCNEKKDGTGDCYPTTAELRDGHWWALRDSGEWIEIPDTKIVREINPDDTGSRAHLCEAYGWIFCFVPPFGGG
jgi:hypothetical protein